MNIDSQKLTDTLDDLKKRLLNERTPAGYWTGQLSSSALSTATAAFALAQADPIKHKTLIQKGLDWLKNNQNPDGGWGDTIKSKTNISTTMLCWAAFTTAQDFQPYDGTITKVEEWLKTRAGSTEPQTLVNAIYETYGKDRTFSVPILTMCALSGRLGSDPWRFVMPLPFELAACPHQIFKLLNLRVVSYALPALIAIGQAIFHIKPPINPITKIFRKLTRNRTLKILEDIQPPNGGFLEATPLTSFVLMSLVAANQGDSLVASRCENFLTASVCDDGSWPIDTNLATWTTTLSINALAQADDFKATLKEDEQTAIRNWLLDQQYKTEHPYTHAAPGGWAWTDLPGAVPDADDTPGAIIALHNLSHPDVDMQGPAFAAVKWLLDLQNRDGGIPTFCRGWGKLPFDQSSPDLTAHTLSAWSLWLNDLPAPAKKQTTHAIKKAIRYLRRNQTPDGSWIPLWFGNESATNHANPVYGTARVLIGLNNVHDNFLDKSDIMIRDAIEWLLVAQNTDGSWGGDKSVTGSIEETALALDAFAASYNTAKQNHPEIDTTLSQATAWLIENTNEMTPTPIGLYFASLWYYEKLYPLTFAIAALQKVKNLLENQT